MTYMQYVFVAFDMCDATSVEQMNNSQSQGWCLMLPSHHGTACMHATALSLHVRAMLLKPVALGYCSTCGMHQGSARGSELTLLQLRNCAQVADIIMQVL